jgi:hypothetical protein
VSDLCGECGAELNVCPFICSLHAAAPALVEALDNALASLETLMAHYEDRMTPADRAGREKVIAEGRGILLNVRQTP